MPECLFSMVLCGMVRVVCYRFYVWYTRDYQIKISKPPKDLLFSCAKTSNPTRLPSNTYSLAKKRNRKRMKHYCFFFSEPYPQYSHQLLTATTLLVNVVNSDSEPRQSAWSGSQPHVLGKLNDRGRKKQNATCSPACTWPNSNPIRDFDVHTLCRCPILIFPFTATFGEPCRW